MGALGVSEQAASASAITLARKRMRSMVGSSMIVGTSRETRACARSTHRLYGRPVPSPLRCRPRDVLFVSFSRSPGVLFSPVTSPQPSGPALFLLGGIALSGVTPATANQLLAQSKVVG